MIEAVSKIFSESINRSKIPVRYLDGNGSRFKVPTLVECLRVVATRRFGNSPLFGLALRRPMVMFLSKVKSETSDHVHVRKI